MDAVISTAPRRHQWLDQLIATPAAEVRALTEGTASIHPFGRAEPSDAAATILFGLGPEDPAVKAFDQGTLEVFVQYRTATVRVDRWQRDRIALTALDLMTVVQRVAPHNTVIDLHRRFAYWNAWAETLVVDRGLDLRREYWRSLSLTQDIAGEAGLASRRLLPFWLSICSEAGLRGRYDESYLTVGLLGLRSLPLGEEAANEEAALHGLARWADAQRPAKTRFLREWHVLAGAFPRDATFWAELVTRVLTSVEEEIARQTTRARRTFPAAEWWREELNIVTGRRVRSRGHHLEPPPRERLREVLADIDARLPFHMIVPRLEPLIQGHERYATGTGDTFYVVRTACNIGMRLLREGADLASRASAARELGRLAVNFEPTNVYAWALWRDALAWEGHLEAAEFVGWESIRLFPENPQWRNQLALLLGDQLDRPREAEELLHDCVRLFPYDPVPRTQLASLLASRLNRPEEAESILREAISLFPDDLSTNIIARYQLASILRRAPTRSTEAKGVLAEAQRIERAHPGVASALRQRSDRPPVMIPKNTKTPHASANVPEDTIELGKSRRALFRMRNASPKSREAINLEFKKYLEKGEYPGYNYYVAAAVGLVTPATDDAIIATAFLAAEREGSAGALDRLLGRVEGVDAVVINLACASRGDKDAALRLQSWMEEPANDLSPRDHGLRAIAARTTSPLPADFVGDMLAASLGMSLVA